MSILIFGAGVLEPQNLPNHRVVNMKYIKDLGKTSIFGPHLHQLGGKNRAVVLARYYDILEITPKAKKEEIKEACGSPSAIGTFGENDTKMLGFIQKLWEVWMGWPMIFPEFKKE